MSLRNPAASAMVRRLANVCALCAALAGPSALAQTTGVPVAPRVLAPVAPQVRAVVLPRVLAAPVMSQAEAVPADQIHKLDTSNLPTLATFKFEAEDWGERPDLGFTVQDMSGWGSEWSGNKQIFWNPQPPGYAFKWDFSVAAGRMLYIHLTAAPDYANLSVELGCYRQVSANYYERIAQHPLYFDGYATSVRRKTISFPLTMDPKCRTADLYRLLFVAKQSEGRTFAGIDSIEVTR